MEEVVSDREEKVRDDLRFSHKIEPEKARGSSPVTVNTATSSCQSIISSDSESLGMEDHVACNSLETQSQHIPKSHSLVTGWKEKESSATGDTKKKKKKKFIKVRAGGLGLDCASTHDIPSSKSMDRSQLEEAVKHWKAEKEAEASSPEEARRSARPQSKTSSGSSRAGRAARRSTAAQENRKRSVSRRRRRSTSSSRDVQKDCEEAGKEDTDSDLDEKRVQSKSWARSRRLQRHASLKGHSLQDEDTQEMKPANRTPSRARSGTSGISLCPKTEQAPGAFSRSQSFSHKNFAPITPKESGKEEEVDEFGFAVKYVAASSSGRKEPRNDQKTTKPTFPGRRGVLRASSFSLSKSHLASSIKADQRGVGRSKSDDLWNLHNMLNSTTDDEKPAASVDEKVLRTGIITLQQLVLLVEAGFQITEAE